MSATGTLSRLAAPFVIANTLVTPYTVGGGKKARVKRIRLMNDHSSVVLVDMHMVPSGGSASATNKMFKGAQPSGLFLRPGETKDLDLDTVLETGESVQFIANVDAKVTGRISGLEISGSTLYKRLWAPTLISTSGTSVLGYAGNVVPAATKLRLREIILMNDHSVLEVINLHMVPSGGTAVAGNKMFKGVAPYGLTLQPGETRILPMDDILEVGEAIVMGADIAAGGGSGSNKVSCRGSGLEVA